MSRRKHISYLLLIHHRGVQSERCGVALEKRRLGRTGLSVSVIGFGGIPIIEASWKSAVRTVRRAFELGVNYFDTARAYGDSEEKIGEALHNVRDRVVLATKTHQKTKEEAARAGLKHSLRNLRTDRIDLVQLHGIDDEKTLDSALRPDGSLAALKEARSAGIIGHVGITGHRPYILAKALQTNEFDTVLVPLNLITREATEGLIPLAKQLDIGVVIMKPFGGIDLNYAERDCRAPNPKVFDKVFGGRGAEKARRALRFVLAHDIATTVPGLRSPQEVEYAVAVADKFRGLNESERKRYRFGELPLEPFCRECGLCVPCPEGINIPAALRFEKYANFYGLEAYAKEQYQRLNTKADGCTRCGECVKKCPYHLDVISMINSTHEDLAMRA